MKVFISHSSADNWVARRISSDLESLGVETFLDEKDIQTGESIDDSIHDHLRTSDELLMLLSPQALASHWVLLEIGGARALGIRLIPITMHVAANELPQPLSKGLARDINDIDRYYDEVKIRMPKSPSKRAPAKKIPARTRATSRSGPKKSTITVGDVVRLPKRLPPDDAIRTAVGWHPDMDSYIGRVATVTNVFNAPDEDPFPVVEVDVDGGQWYWATEWLEKV